MGRQIGAAAMMGLALLAWSSGPAGAQATPAESRVETVTLYRDQALVTRGATADLPAGMSELVVGDLPLQILPDSLFASAGPGAQVRAVRYRARAVREEPREEIRQLDQQIEALQEELHANEAMSALVQQRRQYLEKLEQFSAPTAQVELSKGVLDAATLEKLTTFIFDQRRALTEESLELRKSKRDLSEQLSVLTRRKGELTAGSTRTVREALIFVDSEKAGPSEIQLSYLVGQAGWEPAYNFRAEDNGEAVTMEYNATIHQMSGEPWQGVSLVLSTASPALMAKGPELAPFWVSLASPEQVPRQAADLGARQKQFSDALKLGRQQQQRAADLRAEREAVWATNLAAIRLQELEIANPKSELQRVRPREVERAEGWSVTYELPGRVSLQSRADRQVVQIASHVLPSTFYYVATPLLTNYVYREAQVTNESPLALLEGPATCYLDGRFVGRSRVPMLAAGQKFRTGFGLNSQMRAARELISKSERTVGGNRQQHYHYRVGLENFSERPFQVRLYERTPEPMRGADIRVTLGEMSHELSENPSYLEREHRQGILRWDVTVPPGAAGLEALKVDYRYTLEFDRQLTVTTPLETGAQREEARQQFQELLEIRMMAE